MSKITKQDAGRKGGEKFAENCAARKKVAEDLYNLTPKLCVSCGSALPYLSKNMYCSRSCFAQTRESLKPKQNSTCQTCNSLIKNNKTFCSIKCVKEGQYKNKTLPAIERGEITDRNTLKNHLSRINGYKCMVCGLSEWRDVLLSLELDHIDGDASNNMPTNIQMICPNCHSITTNWKGRNKGSGRKSRGLPLH